MTDEERRDYIQALLREKEVALHAGMLDRVAAVTAELRKIGAEAEPPAKRATKRVTR